MAGYSFTTPVNHNHHHHYHHKNNRSITPNTSSFGSNRLFRINKISTSKSHNKISKSKHRFKINTFQSDEREKFKKMLSEYIFSPINFNKTPKIHKESAIVFKKIDHIKNNIETPMTKSVSLVDLVKSKGFSVYPTHQNNEGFLRKDSLTSRQSRLSHVQNWKLPEKSNDFKTCVENKFGLIYSPTKEKAPSASHESDVSDSQLFEKLNHVEIYKNNRKSITSKIKSMFEPFIPFNFYCKFKRYIPYIHRDHEISERIKVVEDVAPKLTDEIEAELEEILTSPNKPLVSAFSINIETKDLLTLKADNWLNDSVIEFYLNLIVSRSQQQPKKLPSVYAFSTYFFTRLSNGSTVGRWANKLDFFSYELLLVPIHYASHWRLAVIDNEKKTIKYYDSLGNEFPYCIDLLIKFLMNESLTKKKTQLDLSEWKILFRVPNIPEQQNGYDCGVFLCKYAEYIARRASLTFTQMDIPDFRKLMMYEIIHKKLLN